MIEFVFEVILLGVYNGFASVIGWICLWVIYRNPEKVQSKLKNEYENNYALAGSTYMLQFFAAIMIIFLTGVILALLVGVIVELFTK